MMETQFFYTNHNAWFLGNTWIISTAEPSRWQFYSQNNYCGNPQVLWC